MDKNQCIFSSVGNFMGGNVRLPIDYIVFVSAKEYVRLSRSPSLGVPVRFTELSNMSVMCEIAYSSDGLTPELSYGSHFFQDLVETGIFYIALFDNKEDVVFNENKLIGQKNIAKKLVNSEEINEDVIKVYYTKGLQVYSDIASQIVTCS